jgi:protocatechuate 3,4-dioxygenase beta subunit
LARSEGHDYVAGAARACTLTAEQEEGPFYVAVDDVRENIVLGQTGLPLELTITIISSLTCKPLEHAAVDIWHCNASGVYSDISSESTIGQTYLRGVQFTDKHGQVTFRTVFPGHYSGRTTHIHARIHVASQDSGGKLTGGHISHTGQMFPSDAVNAEARSPAEQGPRRERHDGGQPARHAGADRRDERHGPRRPARGAVAAPARPATSFRDQTAGESRIRGLP